MQDLKFQMFTTAYQVRGVTPTSSDPTLAATGAAWFRVAVLLAVVATVAAVTIAGVRHELPFVQECVDAAAAIEAEDAGFGLLALLVVEWVLVAVWRLARR